MSEAGTSQSCASSGASLETERRKAPSACGEASGAGGSEEEAGQILATGLLRRLCSQQAESPQFLVRENHLFASVTLFKVSQARDTRKTPEFGRRESQQYCRALLPDLFLDTHAHA